MPSLDTPGFGVGCDLPKSTTTSTPENAPVMGVVVLVQGVYSLGVGRGQVEAACHGMQAQVRVVHHRLDFPLVVILEVAGLRGQHGEIIDIERAAVEGKSTTRDRITIVATGNARDKWALTRVPVEPLAA